MITLHKISKKVGNRTLLDEVSITFNEGCRYGLSGPNGAGKSTLLKIIMELESSNSGSISLPKKVGFLKQNISDFEQLKIIDTVIMGNQKLWDTLQERDRLYEEEMTDSIGMRLGELEEIIAEEDGYTAESDAEILLEGIGIDPDCFEKPMKTLPTDQQFRVLLCQALFGNPQALLLDEPTNHLDLESITWLEGFLFNYIGTLIVVSHDRHFLNTVTTHTADIDYETVIVYPGNYDEMIVIKTSIRQRAEGENKAKEKKITQLKEFVSKFGAGSRASQVQSRVREIKRLEPQELRKSNIQKPFIRFQTPEKTTGQIVFSLEDIFLSYDKPVIENFSCEIHRGDKIGVIGNNGKGKTTLLKLFANQIKATQGNFSKGHQVDIGYFAQNHEEIVDKSININIFDWLKGKKIAAYDQDVRGVLGKMLFSGDDAFKKLPTLSGGETARLILAGLMLTAPNVLILDEPNNHLDLEAVSALSWGLEDYKGTVIVSSHDRELIGNFATKIIALEEDKVLLFDGSLEQYIKGKA